MNTPTPHISAKEGDFADTVLMPGDPLRAQFIAKKYLENAVLVNNVRGVQGYTGKYNGKRVSVMASGMGMPSIGIYSYELYNFYNVKNIIRVGTAAAVSKKLKLRDIVLGMSACTDSNYFSQYGVDAYFAPTASYGLLSKADKECERRGINAAIGTLYSSDVFYDEAKRSQKLADMGILAVEMETAALYLNAARSGKNALSVCTISDCVFDDSSCDSLERERSFTLMAEIALSIA